MHLNTVLPATNFQIGGGSDFLWTCYGPNARYIDFNNKAHEESATCVFDTKTQEVYEIDICLAELELAYKWYNPAYFDKMLESCKRHNVDYTDAWDNVKWTILTSEEEMLAKLTDVLTA